MASKARLLLKSKGLKVYHFRRGVLLDDISGPLTDTSLKFLILSATEDVTKTTIDRIIKEVRERRPDIIGFVNGIPLLFIELKAAHRKLENAYNNNDDQQTGPPVIPSAEGIQKPYEVRDQ